MSKRNSRKHVLRLLVDVPLLDDDMVQSQRIRDVELVRLIGMSVLSVGVCLDDKTHEEEGVYPHDRTKCLQEVVMVAPSIRIVDLCQIT